MRVDLSGGSCSRKNRPCGTESWAISDYILSLHFSTCQFSNFPSSDYTGKFCYLSPNVVPTCSQDNNMQNGLASLGI